MNFTANGNWNQERQMFNIKLSFKDNFYQADFGGISQPFPHAPGEKGEIWGKTHICLGTDLLLEINQHLNKRKPINLKKRNCFP